MLAPWCCFIPSFTYILVYIMYVLLLFDIAFNCRHIVWWTIVMIGVSYICNSLILLQKAHLVLLRQRWVLYTGIPLILPQLGYIICNFIFSYITIDADIGCNLYYAKFNIWYWFCMIIPINVLFSSIFCYVAFHQYRTYGSDAWKRLIREGIQTMCLAVLCNLVSCVSLMLQIGGSKSDMFYLVDM